MRCKYYSSVLPDRQKKRGTLAHTSSITLKKTKTLSANIPLYFLFAFGTNTGLSWRMIQLRYY